MTRIQRVKQLVARAKELGIVNIRRYKNGIAFEYECNHLEDAIPELNYIRDKLLDIVKETEFEIKWNSFVEWGMENIDEIDLMNLELEKDDYANNPL